MWTTRSILLLGKIVTRGIVSLPQQFKMATQNFAQESKEPGAGILQMTPSLEKQKEAAFGYQLSSAGCHKIGWHRPPQFPLLEGWVAGRQLRRGGCWLFRCLEACVMTASM